MRRVIAVMTAMALFGGIGSTASAHFLSHEDPSDTRTDLDMKRTWIERVDRHTTTINVRTYDRFEIDDLYGDEGFTAYVDSRGGMRWDFRITIDLYEDSYPYCNIYDRAGFSRGGGEVDKTPRGMTCPLSATPFDATKQVRWRIVSISKGETDLAPNRGWFKH